jgi:hypothetical protein
MVAMKKFAVAMAAMIAMGITFSPIHALAQDDDEGPLSNMRFVVVRDVSGKPVKNAAVVLHPVSKKGKQAMGGLELKTDEEGKTWIDGIPYGDLRVQVLAPGFQTFGEDYVIKQPETQITVRLKRPTGQFSVYGVQDKNKSYGVQEKNKSTNTSKDGTNKDDTSKDGTSKDGSSKDGSSKDGSSKDKRTDPAAQQPPAQQTPPPTPQSPSPDQKPQ